MQPCHMADLADLTLRRFTLHCISDIVWLYFRVIDMNYQDLTGKRFGRLKAISRIVGASPTTWIFLCECGSKKALSSANVKSGNTKSCGCLHKESHTTHGGSGHPLYKTWKGMVAR